jgi:hypothetical protein
MPKRYINSRIRSRQIPSVLQAIFVALTDSPEREVRLGCPASASQQAYLYHEVGDNYALERDITALTSLS